MKNYNNQNIVISYTWQFTKTVVVLILCAALIAGVLGLCAWVALWVGHGLPVPPAR